MKTKNKADTTLRNLAKTRRDIKELKKRIFDVEEYYDEKIKELENKVEGISEWVTGKFEQIDSMMSAIIKNVHM